MAVFVQSVVIICFKFLFVDMLGPTATTVIEQPWKQGDPLSSCYSISAVNVVFMEDRKQN